MDDVFPLKISNRKKVINLFHGFALKGMGLAQKRRSDLSLRHGNAGKRFQYFLCTSKIAAHNINYCLDGHRIQYILCGQPRNDIFFQNRDVLKRKLYSKLGLSPIDKLILYAPTWREYGATIWFPFEGIDYVGLNNILKSENTYIYIKPHISEKGFFEKNSTITNIRILDDFQDGLQSNELLVACDALITDYSSIFIDFLLLDRPIIFFHSDLFEFSSYNSLLLNNSFWFPGYTPKNFDEFLENIKSILCGKDEFKNQRKLVNSLLNTYETGNASKRIANYLKNESDNLLMREVEL
jgi:CDP-glycerol glycerophosphotransferase